MPAAGVLAFVELGVGCDRAVVLDAAGALVEAHLDRPGPRPGDVWTARLLRREACGWVVALGEAGEARLDGPAAGLAEGALLRVMVVRAAIPGPGRAKPARVRRVPGQPARAPGLATAAPDLSARLRGRGLRVEPVPASGPDRLGAAGWADAVAEARLDAPIPFVGGELVGAMTEAGLVIDVDGHLPPEALALAAVPALAGLLARHDQGGSVLVDFPTLAGRGPRAALDAALGEALARLPGGAGERTAVNGFGLVQIVRPRLRPSLVDLAVGAPAELAALELLRAAVRARGAGPLVMAAAPPVALWLKARPALQAEAAARAGRTIALRSDPALGMWAGHVHTAAPA
jgi:hypothetical protein